MLKMRSCTNRRRASVGGGAAEEGGEVFNQHSPKNSTSAIVKWLAAKSVTAGPALMMCPCSCNLQKKKIFSTSFAASKTAIRISFSKHVLSSGIQLGCGRGSDVADSKRFAASRNGSASQYLACGSDEWGQAWVRDFVVKYCAAFFSFSFFFERQKGTLTQFDFIFLLSWLAWLADGAFMQVCACW